MRSTFHAVAAELTAGRDRGPRTGRDVSRATGLDEVAVHRALRLMEDHGWLVSHWQHHETGDGLPSRRYYTITERGARRLPAVTETNPRP